MSPALGTRATPVADGGGCDSGRQCQSGYCDRTQGSRVCAAAAQVPLSDQCNGKLGALPAAHGVTLSAGLLNRVLPASVRER